MSDTVPIGGKATRNLETDAGGTARNHCSIIHGVLWRSRGDGYESWRKGVGH